MDFFNVVTVNEANDIIMKNFIDYKFEIESIDILSSTDRVLADDIISNIIICSNSECAYYKSPN